MDEGGNRTNSRRPLTTKTPKARDGVAPSDAASPDAAPSDAANARRIDPRVARALDAMTTDLTRAWTVAALAKVAGMSRAAFARRFLADVGTPPLRHLAGLRLARGAKLLVEEGASLAEVSRVIGYESEFAFSRAFKRLFGEAPAAFRRRARTGVTIMRAVA